MWSLTERSAMWTLIFMTWVSSTINLKYKEIHISTKQECGLLYRNLHSQSCPVPMLVLINQIYYIINQIYSILTCSMPFWKKICWETYSKTDEHCYSNSQLTTVSSQWNFIVIQNTL